MSTGKANAPYAEKGMTWFVSMYATLIEVVRPGYGLAEVAIHA
jgi:hypothetical protein